MKVLLASLVFAFVAYPRASAESLSPEEVVLNLIKAAQSGNLQKVSEYADLGRIASAPRHGRSKEDLMKFLKGIDLKKIKFQKIKRKAFPKATLVRMMAPLCMDFDLELIEATVEKQEDYYIVVTVHP